MTREPIHPGETLRDDLEALGMSAAELARRIKVPVNRITQILNGQRVVTGDTALRLGRFFGTSGEFWLNLQKLYELRLAERDHGDEDRASAATRESGAVVRTGVSGSGRWRDLDVHALERRQRRPGTSSCRPMWSERT